MDTLQEITGLALCSGGNGLELGLRIALPNYRTIAISEGEAYCLAATAARIEEGSMGECFVAPDLRKLDARPLRGRINIVSAGFPCQPHSVAGKRAGTEDERWLWPDIDRIIEECQPDLVWLENVAGLLRDAGSDTDTNEDLGIEPDDSIGGMGTVLRDLAERGYDAQWLRLRASRVGASHQRARVFILAYKRVADPGSGQLSQPWRGTEGRTGAGSTGAELANPGCGDSRRVESQSERRSGDQAESGKSGGEVANPTGSRRAGAEDPGSNRRGAREGTRSSEPERIGTELGNPTDGRRRERREPSRGIGQPDGADKELDHSFSKRITSGLPATSPRESQQTESTEPHDRIDRLGITDLIGGIFAPGPSDARWNEVLVLNPWLRPSVSQAEVESPFCNLADGLANLLGHNRTDALRMLGNGVVPLQAAAAFTELLRRIGI